MRVDNFIVFVPLLFFFPPISAGTYLTSVNILRALHAFDVIFYRLNERTRSYNYRLERSKRTLYGSSVCTFVIRKKYLLNSILSRGNKLS